MSCFRLTPGHKKFEEPRIKLFKKLVKSVLSHITFYLEDGDHRPVPFNREAIILLSNVIKYNERLNLNMKKPRNQTQVLLLSTTKNCEKLIEQTHRNAEETLEFKLTRAREAFSFKPSINLGVDSKRITRLISLEVNISAFTIREENNKFELYTDTLDEFSFNEIKDELEEILIFSDITPQHLEHEKIGPRFIEVYKKLGLKKSSTDGYIILLMGYARSPFRDFESYLRYIVGLYGDDIKLILKQYNSHFFTYELSPGIYTLRDFSQAVYTMGDHEGSI